MHHQSELLLCGIQRQENQPLPETDGMNRKLTCFIEEKRILILLHVLRGSGLIQEQRVNPFDVLHLNFCPLKKPKHTDDVNTEATGIHD